MILTPEKHQQTFSVSLSRSHQKQNPMRQICR